MNNLYTVRVIFSIDGEDVTIRVRTTAVSMWAARAQITAFINKLGHTDFITPVFVVSTAPDSNKEESYTLQSLAAMGLDGVGG